MSKTNMMIADEIKAFFDAARLDYAIIIPTKNGLDKGIMDATAAVRDFLLRNNLHSYSEQGQGEKNKVSLTAYFVTRSGLSETVASLYRPYTKKGDPRIWFRKLPDFCNPFDNIAIVAFDGRLYLVNLFWDEALELLQHYFNIKAPDDLQSSAYFDRSTPLHRENLSFSANAKLGKLLGRELITNNIVAVFELIKNSYDAFADEVVVEFLNFDTDGSDAHLELNKSRVLSRSDSCICISDNGIGMTFNDIKYKWMQVGTTNKEDASVRERSKDGRVVRRAINGEKGIGRFGADRLGAILQMNMSGLQMLFSMI